MESWLNVSYAKNQKRDQNIGQKRNHPFLPEHDIDLNTLTRSDLIMYTFTVKKIAI